MGPSVSKGSAKLNLRIPIEGARAQMANLTVQAETVRILLHGELFTSLTFLEGSTISGWITMPIGLDHQLPPPMSRYGRLRNPDQLRRPLDGRARKQHQASPVKIANGLCRLHNF